MTACVQLAIPWWYPLFLVAYCGAAVLMVEAILWWDRP
jgi:hypothetical protein